MENKNTTRSVTLFFTLTLLLVVLTFYNSFYRMSTGSRSYSAWVIVHAFSLALWVVVLFVQPLFIYSGKTKWHKQVGWFSISLVVLIVVSTVCSSLYNFKEMPAFFSPGKKYSIVITQLYGMLLFSVLYTLALLNSKKFTRHIQYMMASTIIILGPVIFRTTYTLGLSFFGTVEFTATVFTYSFITVFLLVLCGIHKRRSENYFPYLCTVIALIPIEVSQLFFAWNG